MQLVADLPIFIGFALASLELPPLRARSGRAMFAFGSSAGSHAVSFAGTRSRLRLHHPWQPFFLIFFSIFAFLSTPSSACFPPVNP